MRSQTQQTKAEKGRGSRPDLQRYLVNDATTLRVSSVLAEARASSKAVAKLLPRPEGGVLNTMLPTNTRDMNAETVDTNKSKCFKVYHNAEELRGHL